MRKLLGVIFLFFVSLAFPSSVSAVTITIDSYPTTISSDIFNVTASVAGATNATNYLRADLYKEGTSNYFGETYNGSDWYSGSEGKSYFPILIQNASASATFQVQLGNPSSTQYLGPGTYKLKIRRYTSSGSASSNDTQDPVDIQITYSTPSPTTIPTTDPTQAPNSTPTPTKSATPILTKSPTPKPTKSPSPSPEVLGEEVTPSPYIENPTSTPLVLDSKEKKVPIIPVVLIVSGLAMIGFAILQLVNAKKSAPED